MPGLVQYRFGFRRKVVVPDDDIHPIEKWVVYIIEPGLLYLFAYCKFCPITTRRNRYSVPFADFREPPVGQVEFFCEFQNRFRPDEVVKFASGHALGIVHRAFPIK